MCGPGLTERAGGCLYFDSKMASDEFTGGDQYENPNGEPNRNSTTEPAPELGVLIGHRSRLSQVRADRSRMSRAVKWIMDNKASIVNQTMPR